MDKKTQSDIDKLMPVLIRKHEWKNTSDNWGEYCIYCDCRICIGTGTDHVGECELRFNEEKFQEFIEFKGYSIAPIDITNHRGTKKYFKRFTAISISEQELIVLFAKTFNIKGAEAKIKLIKSLRK